LKTQEDIDVFLEIASEEKAVKWLTKD